jgi:hypothetical protein
MAITGNGTRVLQDLEQWASGHETSYEIALAISEICRTPRKMQRVWETPTKREEKQILDAAWALAGDEDTLFWGCERIERS